ncbi:MAG: N-methyl-L-tryptophan oxidase [Saprospiraceae bacterium]
MDKYDYIIIGGGTMGAATSYYLARTGASVLLLEQFGFIHENGAHGGQSRIIRKAYFEHPDYVPLLERAYENWIALETFSNTKLYHKTGLLYVGQPGDELIENALQAAKMHGIEMQKLNMDFVKESYPALSVPDDWIAYLEPDAGFLLVEECLRTFLEQAAESGAELKDNEKVLSWTRNEDGLLSVQTENASYQGKKLIFCAGAWTNKILKDLGVPLKITRQVLGWVRPANAHSFSYGNLPCWFVSDPDHGLYYGMPVLNEDICPGPYGLKIGWHKHGEICDPERVDRAISAQDIDNFMVGLKKYFPTSIGEIVDTKTCLYANSPDENFIIDFLPDNKNVVFACGFSGHGFKFASVIGEILADLATKGETELPIEFLRIRN